MPTQKQTQFIKQNLILEAKIIKIQ